MLWEELTSVAYPVRACKSVTVKNLIPEKRSALFMHKSNSSLPAPVSNWRRDFLSALLLWGGLYRWLAHSQKSNQNGNCRTYCSLLYWSLWAQGDVQLLLIASRVHRRRRDFVPVGGTGDRIALKSIFADPPKVFRLEEYTNFKTNISLGRLSKSVQVRGLFLTFRNKLIFYGEEF